MVGGGGGGSTPMGFAFCVHVQPFPFQVEILSNQIICSFLPPQAKPAIAQLRHLSNNDFTNVREAARKALAALGMLDHVTVT